MFQSILKTIIFLILFSELVLIGFQTELWSRIPIGEQVAFARSAEVEPELKMYGMDWFPPVIKVKKNNKTTNYTQADFIVVSDSKILASTLPTGWSFTPIPSGEVDQSYGVLTTSKFKPGRHEFEIPFEDFAGNQTLSKIKINAQKPQIQVRRWSNDEYVLPVEDTLILVNKNHKLPQDYSPDDLVTLASLNINNTNKARIRSIARKDLKSMVSAINKQGINYNVSSGFRSYSDQVDTYNFWLKYNDGNVAATDTVSARPGYSEHQLGVTIDFTTSENGNIFYQFERTRLGVWLGNNAHKYGFTMSYPPGKDEITGYSYEPWHYRYVGKELSLELKKQDLTLTEYLLNQE